MGNFNMKQAVIETWGKTKEKYPDTLILVCDEGKYYALKEDSHKSQECGLGVQRDTENDIEFASFDFCELDTFLPKLIRRGNRVAITNIY